MELKIYGKEVIEYLKEAGVSDIEIKRIKYNKLKKRVIERLKTITEMIENEEYDDVKNYLTVSPAGDGMGCENSYIDFSDIVILDEYDGTDLGNIISELIKLKTNVK